MSRACLHRQIHEQRLRLSAKAADDPGSRKNAPRTLRSERGTPPATPLTRGPWQVQTSRAKTAAFPSSPFADHHLPPLMHAGRRPGRKPSLHLSPRAPSRRDCERPPSSALRAPSPASGRRRERVCLVAIALAHSLLPVIPDARLDRAEARCRARAGIQLWGNHARNAGSWAPAGLTLPPRAWHCPSMCFHLTASGEVIPVLSRTAKTDVLVNCARIGFKP